MNRSVLEVVLSFVDSVTAPMRKSQQGIEGLLNDMKNRVVSVTGTIKTAFEALGVTLGAAALGAFLKKCVDESLEAEKAVSFLRQAVNNAGESFAAWQPKVNSAIDNLVKKTRFGDDEYRAALTNMIAKTGDVGGSLGNLQLAADIAAKKHISLAEAGDLVGKAMTGSEKVFKEFGITQGTTTEKMEQLRIATHGYAEADLNTLGGRLAQGKTAFREMQEQIGNMITGSAGAAQSAGLLTSSMVDLAKWLEKNKDKGIEFVDSLVSTGVAIGHVLKPIWDLVVAIKDGVEAVVGWSNVWKGIQIVLVTVAGAFGILAGDIKLAIGGILEVIGLMLSVAAPVLDKFGLGVGKLSDGILTAGHNMVETAKKSLTDVATTTTDKLAMIAMATKTGQQKITKEHDDPSKKRTQVTDEELKKQEEATKRSHESLAKLQEIAYKASEQLVNVYQRELNAITHTFQQEMQKQDAADKAESEKLLKKMLEAQIQKWIGYEAQVVPVSSRLKTQVITDASATALALDNQGEHTTKAALNWDLFKLKAGGAGETMQKAASLAGDLADALGNSDPQLRQAITSLGQLGQAMTSVSTGDVLGGLTGAIGALGGLLGSLFGTSPAELARRALLEKNSEAMDRLRGEVHSLNLSTAGGKLSTFAGLTVDEAFASAPGEPRSRPQNGTITKAQLGEYLVSKGLSMADFRQLAGDLGIDLGEGSFGFNVDAVASVFAGAKIAKTKSPYGTDFGGRQSASADARAARGETGAAPQLRDLEQNLADADATWLAGYLKSFGDLGDEQNRRAARQSVGQFLQDIAAGKIDPSLFGGLSGAESIGALNSFIGLLGQYDSEAQATYDKVFGSAPSSDAGYAAPTVSPTAPSIDVPTTSIDYGNQGFAELLAERLDVLHADLEHLKASNDEIADGVMQLVRAGGAGGNSAAIDETLQGMIDQTTTAFGG